MPSVRKKQPAPFKKIDREVFIASLEIHAYRSGRTDLADFSRLRKRFKNLSGYYDVDTNIEYEFKQKYHHSYEDIIEEVQKWRLYLSSEGRFISLNKIYDRYSICISIFDKEPTRLLLKDNMWHIGEGEWIFKGYVYEVNEMYSDDEIRLLILESFDKERRYFEKLKVKFDKSETIETNYSRPRIPEKIRIEVWRRDGGKCAKCGSREKLEYDHIVPISKGGSNTARNIELLCEKCNRSKANNIA